MSHPNPSEADNPSDEANRVTRTANLTGSLGGPPPGVGFHKGVRFNLTAIQTRAIRTALAEKVNLSQSACSRRLDILEKSGVIQGYHAKISNAAIGHSVTVIVHMSLSGQSEKILAEFEAAVKRCPNVLVCYLMSGEYDYLLRIAAKDLGSSVEPQLPCPSTMG